MAQLYTAEWLAGSSRGSVGGATFHCSPPLLQQQGLSHRAEPGAEWQARGRATTASPEAPGASAGDQSSGSSSELSAPEQEAWEDQSHCSETSAAASGGGRTKFSAAQLRELERSFQERRYLGAGEKRRLSKVLKLTPTQIKTWFQNRRMKFKRQAEEARVRALFSGFYHRYPGMCVPSCLPGLEYNIAYPPSGIMPLHPALPYPALLAHSYPSLSPFVPNTPFQFSAAVSYQPTGQSPFLTPDYERLRFHSHFLPS